eukprot:368102_1
MSLMSVYSIFVFITILEATIISPTHVTNNGTTENYINSEHNTTIQPGDTINCGTITCNIECNRKRGCYAATINAGNTTTTMNIKCNGYESCEYMKIYADLITTLNMKCTNHSSCQYMNIYADTAQNIAIKCDWNESSWYLHAACGRQKLYAKNANHTNLYCGANDCYRIYYDLNNALTATIHSDGPFAMDGAWIVAKNMKNLLNITCNGSRACEDITVDTGSMTADALILCYDYLSCYSGTLRADIMKGNVHIICDGYGLGACQHFMLYTDQIEGSLTLDCLNLDSCRNIGVFCPHTSCNINCLKANSCPYSTIYITNQFEVPYLNLECSNISSSCSYGQIKCDVGSSTLSFDSLTNEWSCSNFECCPFERNNKSCTIGESCKIDCNDESCRGYNIDGSKATSLILICSQDYSCEGVNIQCPSLYDNATCIIYCSGNYSCQYSQIVAGNGNTLSLMDLKCGGYNACSSISLEINATQVVTVNINCSAQYSCYLMDVTATANITNVVTNCNGIQACYSMVGKYIIVDDNFTMNCLSEKSCEAMKMHLVPNKRTMISCLNSNITTVPAGAACGGAYFYIYGYSDNATGSNVFIHCSWYDCYGTRFNIYDSYHVDINCLNPYSCQNAQIEANTSKQLYLTCNDKHACSYLEIHCPSHDIGVCNVDCSSNGYSCSNTQIYVPDFYVYDYLVLYCDSDPQNLTGSIIDAAYTCSGLSITCELGSKSPITYIYDDTIDDYECSHSGNLYCCPYYQGLALSCLSNQKLNCNIDCTVRDCSNHFIDGTDALILTVTCAPNHCTNTHILCPDKARCNIECNGEYSCKSTNIIYNGDISDNGHISLHCKFGVADTFRGGSACYKTNINAEYINTLNITCTADPDAMQYMQLSGICYYATINAGYANAVNVYLDGKKASYNTDYNLQNVKMINFNAHGYSASYGDTFHSENGENVTINCISNGRSACYDNYWYLPYSNGIINCYGNGCSDFGDIYTDNTNFSGLNFNMHSCGKCSDAADCLERFQLHCANGVQSFSNRICGLTNNDNDVCGCNHIIDNAIFSTTLNVDKCYTPTTTIKCDENEDCKITCDTTTQSCANTTIDGSKSSHLTVNCFYNGYCKDSYIICPKYGCSLICGASGACYKTKLSHNADQTAIAKIYIKCSVINSCYALTIKTPDANCVEIESASSGISGSNLYANNVDKLTINALGTNALRFNNIIATFASAVYIYLYDGASLDNNYYLNNAKLVNVYATGYGASREDKWTLQQATNITVNCISDIVFGSCQENDWYLPSSGATFNCYGTGCNRLSKLYITESNFSGVDFNMYSCDKCDNVFDCFGYFILNCALGSQKFLQDVCALDDDGKDICDCNGMLNNAKFYISDNSNKCYTPTPITCGSEDCEITCNKTAQSCMNAIINASEANHLTVKCLYHRSCQNAAIKCPTNGCSLICDASNSCYNTKLSYDGNQADAAKIYIKCAGTYSCQYLHVEARNASRVHIDSSGYGLYNAYLYVNSVNNLTINASGTNSMYLTRLYAEMANNVILACQSNLHKYGCYRNYLFLPDEPIILCYGWGCYGIGTLHFDNNDNNAVWKLNGCNQCHSISECLHAIDFECGRTITTSYYYSDKFCYSSNNSGDSCSWWRYGNCSTETNSDFYTIEDCGCYELFNGKIEFSNDENCYVEFPKIAPITTRSPITTTLSPKLMTELTLSSTTNNLITSSSVKPAAMSTEKVGDQHIITQTGGGIFIIIGIVSACLLVIICISFSIWFYRKKKRWLTENKGKYHKSEIEMNDMEIDEVLEQKRTKSIQFGENKERKMIKSNESEDESSDDENTDD